MVGVGEDLGGVGAFRERRFELENEAVTREGSCIEGGVLVEGVGDVGNNDEIVEIEGVVVNT